MTLKEVLLILGGHAGLLVHGFQKDGYPKGTGGQGGGGEQEVSAGRVGVQVTQTPAKPSSMDRAKLFKGSDWVTSSLIKGGETKVRAHVLGWPETVGTEHRSSDTQPLPLHPFPVTFPLKLTESYKILQKYRYL